jgi:cholesterol oxidase
MNAIFDYIIVGSGFGGSVSALRLAERGYKVLVIERGQRFTKTNLPKTNWDLKNYLWAPKLGLRGLQDITLLKGVMVLHGSGVGGGSLVYANTLMRPADKVLSSPEWRLNKDWIDRLSEYFSAAEKMLGVCENPLIGPADDALAEMSLHWDLKDQFKKTRVGVYFGDKEKAGIEVEDPYFSGQGPKRSGCTGCGACMVGCRVGAKNTLDLNYLYLAEKLGVKIIPDCEVSQIIPIQNSSHRYELKANGKVLKAKNVVLAAGVLGTLKLLFKNRDEFKTLPNISSTLGFNVRTNGESLCGSTSFDETKNFSKGIAIGSVLQVDANMKIEPVRYSEGSDLLRFLSVPLTGAGGPILRPLKLLFKFVTSIRKYLKLLFVKDWAKSSIILLVMQTIDQKLNLTYGRCGLHLFSKTLKISNDSDKVPAYIPMAQKAAKDLADIIKGEPQNIISEVLLGIPATAHILGGIKIGETVADSVVNANFEVHGYPHLYVCDGSLIPVNLGVNPSLTITALAEYWASQIQNS